MKVSQRAVVSPSVLKDLRHFFIDTLHFGVLL